MKKQDELKINKIAWEVNKSGFDLKKLGWLIGYIVENTEIYFDDDSQIEVDTDNCLIRGRLFVDGYEQVRNVFIEDLVFYTDETYYDISRIEIEAFEDALMEEFKNNMKNVE
jgi:hypothetical protein